MSEPKEMIVGSEEPDAEVELTAQELRELSEPRDQSERERDPIDTPTLPTKAATTTAAPSARALPMDAGPAQSPHVPISRLSLSLALAIGAIGALCLLMAPSEEAGQPMTLATLERAPQREWLESEPNVEGEPVRFANPFDAHEVFEFAPGTSEAEARDTVAQMLLERAVARQRQFDALVSKTIEGKT